MAEYQESPTNKEKHLRRLREKYPEKSFEDEEEIYGQIGSDYDQFEQDITGYKDREKALSDMFAADPRSAQFLVDMHKGEDPVVGLVRNFGIEIKDILDDPEMQEQLKAANKEYVERVAKNRELEEEYDRNMAQTLETLRDFQAQHGLGDEQVDELVASLSEVISDGIRGKFSPETLLLFMNAINHDSDVAQANEEGTIAGRNSRILETLRQSQKGDGTRPLAGRNSPAGSNEKSDIFSLASEAM